MTQPKMINIAYPDNQLVQRYVGSRQIQGKELKFFLDDGAIRQGFVTGIDDKSFQVTRVPELTSSLLFLEHIVEVEETGRTFDDLPDGQDEEVKKYTKIFRRVSERELKREDDS